MDYARSHEIFGDRTIDDHLATALKYIDRLETSTGLRWRRNSWWYVFISGEREVVDRLPGCDDDCDPGKSHTEYDYKEKLIDENSPEAREIISTFMLDPNIPTKDVVDKSPKALIQILRSQPDEVVQRTDLCWEKPIPQAA